MFGVLKAAGTPTFSLLLCKAEQTQFFPLLTCQELQSPDPSDGLSPAFLWDEAPASPCLQPGKFSALKPCPSVPSSLVSPRKFLGVLYAIIQAVNDDMSIVPLRTPLLTGSHLAHHKPLSLAAQLIFHLLYRPAIPIFPIWLQAFCGRPCPKMFWKPKYTTSTAVPLFTELSISSQGAVRLPKADLSSVNGCELFTDTFFRFMCFQQDFCVASPGSWCCSICAGTSFSKKMIFPFSQPLETSSNEHEPVGSDESVVLSWSALLASYLVLWNCIQLD